MVLIIVLILHWRRQLWGTGACAPRPPKIIFFSLHFTAEQSLTAASVRLPIQIQLFRLLSHHTVIWLGYIVYFCATCLYGYGFLSGGKDSGVNLRTLVRLLFGISCSHFGELWPRGGSPEDYGPTNLTWENFAERLGGQSELGAVWWDLRLADAVVFHAVCFCGN